MLSLILLSIGLISANLPYINTVTVDNRNDAECFHRIHKEAMIPPNRVFRSIETNSLRECKERCIGEGRRCQSFALGISALGGGNGTCQLSKERVPELQGRRPRNTVYDPDYNLYQRIENCGIPDNNEMPPKDEEMPTMITIQTDMSSDRPAMPVITTSTTKIHTNTMMSSSGETDRSPTVQTTADSSTTNDIMSTSMNSISTNPSMSEKPVSTTSTENQSTQNNPSTFSSGTMPTTNMYPSTVDSTKMPSPPTVMTTMDRFPSTATSYGNTNTDLSTNEVKPETYPTIYMSSSKPDDFNYPYPQQFHNKYNYYHEIYPVYTYPTYYESSYSGSYYPGPPSSGSGSSGSGGNSGSGYAPNIPTINYQPDIDYYGTTPTMSSVPNTASTYMGNGWSNADELNRRKQNGPRYPDREHSGSYPEGKYNGTRTPATVPYIRTIFNPDFYLMDAKNKPSGDVNNGNNKYDYRPSPTLATQRPCFRRALAGKRVSPQWVRRTLMCERVDDCQAECGLEKRFLCEGFNYKLDPSGQGQGICELIDVPLAEMDLYSSASRRDEVLIYHPDYDYYERDRNACRPSFCKDCGSGSSGKPYLPRPESQSPPKYFPEAPPSSYSSDDRDHGHHSGGKPYLPVSPDYNTQPTTYRPIDNFKPFLITI